jgi:endoglucanase
VPSTENCTVQKGFNQVFVDAVRATGGNNASRTLVFQGYNTDINNTIGACGAPVPSDTISGRLMMEFHYYDSFNFTLNDKSAIWQWGSIATDPKEGDGIVGQRGPCRRPVRQGEGRLCRQGHPRHHR